MRILYIINNFDAGGAEHGLLTLIRTGFFEGHDLTVLAFGRGRGPLAGEFARVLAPEKLVLATQGEDLTFAACLSGFALALRMLRDLQPNLLVLSLKQANIVGRLAAAFHPSVRCVSFEHIARYRARRAQLLYAPALWALSWRVDEIWADCRQTLEETGRYFLPRRRDSNVVPLFCVAPAGPSKTSYAAATEPRIAMAGRLVARKNFAVAIAAVAALREQGVAVRLDIYGDGVEQPALSRAIAGNGLHDRVRLLGYRAGWLEDAATADIFLNLGDVEGFCIVVAEAMSAGLPVAAFDAGGIRDYGADGTNMVKLRSTDVASVVAAIRSLLADENLRRRLGAEARRCMLAGYTADAMRQRGKKLLSK